MSREAQALLGAIGGAIFVLWIIFTLLDGIAGMGRWR